MNIVSACLAGIKCRYNGNSFSIPEVIAMVERGEAIPICPEVLANMPIPRPAAELRDERIVSNQGDDLTNVYWTGAQAALQIALLAGCKQAILKAKSPTCGSGRIYDGTFSGRLVDGDGIFAKLLKDKGIKVYTEEEFKERKS